MLKFLIVEFLLPDLQPFLVGETSLNRINMDLRRVQDFQSVHISPLRADGEELCWCIFSDLAGLHSVSSK